MPNTLHIRDKNTGLFYDRYQFHGHNMVPACTLAYATKGFGKAFKDIGKVKVHILHLIGNMDPPKMIRDLEEQLRDRTRVVGWCNKDTDPEYQRIDNELNCWYELHPGYQNVPEWMTNDYPVDEIPSSWEVVEVTDKRQREWTTVDFDPRAYAEEVTRLRLLTDTYGSAVRDVYKKLDKSGKLHDLPWVAAVMLDISTLDQKSYNWWEGATVDQSPVDEAVKRMGTKRRDMVRSSKKESVAIAFRDQADAFMFKMCYDGIDRVGVLDMVHLTEMVSPKTA